MADLTLEERVAALERQMAELKATVANGTQEKDWRRTIGMFTGDEVMKRIDEEALKYRERDRERARRRFAREDKRPVRARGSKDEVPADQAVIVNLHDPTGGSA